MPRKTLKQRRRRQRTLRRVRRVRKGGADGQTINIPSSSFGAPIGAPVNSDNAWYKIA